MKKCTSLFLPATLIILFTLANTDRAYGQESSSLVHIESLNAVIDFRKHDPKEVISYLNYVHGTFMGAKKIAPGSHDFVIVFSGPVVKHLSTNRSGIPGEEHELLENIENLIAAMTKDGIRMEICLFATKLSGIETETILPEIDQVENAWLSLIVYQAKDYSLLPLY